METFILTVIGIALALSVIGWIADYRADKAGGRSSVTPGLSLLTGDITYESEGGNVRIYLPIVTSIVVSIVLTLLLRLFS